MKNGRRGTWLVVVCMLVSLLLAVMPLPDALDWLRPSFALLAIVYWAAALPERFGTWTGFWVGLFMDVLRGTPLGMHALAFSVVGFGASQLAARMKVYPMPQQVGAVLLLCLGALGVTRFVASLAGVQVPAFWAALLPVVVTAALWPWAFALQDRLRRAFNVH